MRKRKGKGSDLRNSREVDYGPHQGPGVRRNSNIGEWGPAEPLTVEPVKRKNKVTNFHNMSMTRPSMQTLDRRISVSSDQLDTMKAGAHFIPIGLTRTR